MDRREAWAQVLLLLLAAFLFGLGIWLIRCWRRRGEGVGLAGFVRRQFGPVAIWCFTAAVLAFCLGR